MRFRSGQDIVRRYHKAGIITWVQATTVVEDTGDSLLLWVPLGAPLLLYRDPVGRSLKEAPIDQLAGAALVHSTWRHYSTLIQQRDGLGCSVWWMFADEQFTGWYVNLENPSRRHSIGIDTTDHALDLEIEPSGRVSWKDEAEFIARTGHRGYWDEAQAATIRATAEQVASAASAGLYPFDGTHCDFRPDPTWPVPRLPHGWDRPPE